MSQESLVAEQFQDLGDASLTIREAEETGPQGVELLLPDNANQHLDALGEIRDVIEKYYGDTLDRLAGDGEQVIITRAEFPSDDLPHIEYAIVADRERE